MEEDVESIVKWCVFDLSGSGPAYLYRMVEPLAAAGEAKGLSPEVTKVPARRAIVGVGAMLGANGEEPVVLRERIMSPGGTTAGLEAMERAGFARLIHEGTQQAPGDPGNSIAEGSGG